MYRMIKCKDNGETWIAQGIGLFTTEYEVVCLNSDHIYSPNPWALLEAVIVQKYSRNIIDTVTQSDLHDVGLSAKTEKAAYKKMK